MESGDDDVVSEDLSVETSSCIGKMSILNYMSTIGNYTGYPFSQEDIQTLLYGIASQRYGITSLHSFQIEAAENAIFGNNTLVIQPTGSGKSLCYQLVALQTKQVVLVFTPTIALMQDQVQQLRSMITKEHSEELVLLYFMLSGDQQLEALPADVIVSLPFVSDIETSQWKAAASWVKWWTKPSHLSMSIIYTFNKHKITTQ